MSDPPTAPLRVLYIEDDPGLARLVQKELARRGYEVVCAQSGDEGLAHLSEGGFDAVALDHFLPGREGLEVLTDIRALPDAPPVIYVTGAQESRIAVAALKNGAADYVIKDVSDDFTALLAAAVGEAIERQRLNRDKEAAEAEVRHARDRAEALLREMNHRIGNSLQLIASFIGLQARRLTDEPARQALNATLTRIEAVAQVHRRLYTSADVETVQLGEYLASLVEQLRQSLTPDDGAPRIELMTTDLGVKTDQAVSLGVIVTELVTNAVKYAYPDGAEGVIRVRLEPQGDSRAVLTVEDDGVGLSETPKGTGLGQTIISAMASNLNSKVQLDTSSGGLRARMVFDL